MVGFAYRREVCRVGRHCEGACTPWPRWGGIGVILAWNPHVCDISLLGPFRGFGRFLSLPFWVRVGTSWKKPFDRGPTMQQIDRFDPMRCTAPVDSPALSLIADPSIVR